MLLEHVKELVTAFQEKRRAEPIRLLLLGTAGTGKTRAIKTCIQEIKQYLYSLDLPLDFQQTFIRAAAPTGTDIDSCIGSILHYLQHSRTHHSTTSRST